MGKLHDAITRSAERAIEKDGRWLICETGIVAENEDPDNQHRIKVILPSIAGEEVYDDWVRPAPFCMGDGLGLVMIPPRGSEVLVTGVLGQKYNLCYHGAVYNEEMAIPAELGIDTPGIKVPENLSFIVGMQLLLQAENMRLVASQLLHAEAETIESIANDLNKVSGDEVRIEGATKVKVVGQTIEITGGAVKITGTSIKLFNRTVNPVGPSI